MPGKEIKGRSKIANYRHGGRTGKQFGGPLTQPGVAQPGVAQPGVAQSGVMPTRPLGLKDGGRIKRVGGGAVALGAKGVKWLWKNRKKVKEIIYSPEGKKKTKDMLDKLKQKYSKK
mgnify:FL=1